MHVPRVGLKLRSGSGSAVTSAAARFVGVGVALMRLMRIARKSLSILAYAILEFGLSSFEIVDSDLEFGQVAEVVDE